LTVIPATVAFERSPVALVLSVLPSARAVTVPTVTSPPKSETELIWLEADAVAFVPTSVDAEAVIEPVVMIEPSLGYAKLPAKPTLSEGAETEVEEAPACAGTTTLIPYALAVAPARTTCTVAPAGPTASSSTTANEEASETRMAYRWIMRNRARRTAAR
jgi:hypothetical protein